MRATLHKGRLSKSFSNRSIDARQDHIIYNAL